MTNIRFSDLPLSVAIGGTIGTGIFLSSGSAVADAGPAGALIAYVVVGKLGVIKSFFCYRKMF